MTVCSVECVHVLFLYLTKYVHVGKMPLDNTFEISSVAGFDLDAAYAMSRPINKDTGDALDSVQKDCYSWLRRYVDRVVLLRLFTLLLRVFAFLLRIIKSLLPLAVVPVERPRNAINPVLTPSIERQNAREGVAAG